MGNTPKPEPFSRDEFTTFHEMQSRWQDVDVYGHVNNVVYFSYFDTAVNTWYIEQDIIDPKGTDGIFLVARNACDFFKEINFPDTIHVGIGVAKMGNSSVRYKIGLFGTDQDTASANGEYVHIFVDSKSRKPMPIPQSIRQKLLAM